jgi:hypothetical protein
MLLLGIDAELVSSSEFGQRNSSGRHIMKPLHLRGWIIPENLFSRKNT